VGDETDDMSDNCRHIFIFQ